MCMSSPKVQKQDPVQEAKQPDATELYRARKKNLSAQAGTLLTSPSGVDAKAGLTGATTLLGS